MEKKNEKVETTTVETPKSNGNAKKTQIVTVNAKIAGFNLATVRKSATNADETSIGIYVSATQLNGITFGGVVDDRILKTNQKALSAMIAENVTTPFLDIKGDEDSAPARYERGDTVAISYYAYKTGDVVHDRTGLPVKKGNAYLKHAGQGGFNIVNINEADSSIIDTNRKHELKLEEIRATAGAKIDVLEQKLLDWKSKGNAEMVELYQKAIMRELTQ